MTQQQGRFVVWTVPFLAAVLGAAALGVWLFAGSAPQVAQRLPGQEVRMPGTAPIAPKAVNEGTLITGSGKPSVYPGNWVQYRGDARDGVAQAGPHLSRSWGDGEPKALWKIEVGEGHAGPVVRDGRIYLMDYDAQKQEDAFRCLSLDDGSEIWRYTHSVKVKRNHGMSRTTPAVNDKFVVAMGPMGHVYCLDEMIGARVWQIDLVKEYGATIPEWYAGQCPLIEGDRVVLAPGGDPLMMTVELATGKIVWRTPNPGGWKMTHSSIVAMDADGVRQYVYCTTLGAVGVSATDGKLLWTKPDWKITLANVPMPVPVGENRALFTGAYNSGSMMLRILRDRTEEVFRLKPSVFASDMQTPILYQDHLYTVIPRGELSCLGLDGKPLWTSGAAKRFGQYGPYLIADGLILVLNDQTGVLTLAEADSAAYRELAQAKVLDGHDAWAPMALVGNRLLLRDMTTLVCLELPVSG
jgi:outer membrane protein assembly factor BamB